VHSYTNVRSVPCFCVSRIDTRGRTKEIWPPNTGTTNYSAQQATVTLATGLVATVTGLTRILLIIEFASVRDGLIIGFLIPNGNSRGLAIAAPSYSGPSPSRLHWATYWSRGLDVIQ